MPSEKSHLQSHSQEFGTAAKLRSVKPTCPKALTSYGAGTETVDPEQKNIQRSNTKMHENGYFRLHLFVSSPAKNFNNYNKNTPLVRISSPICPIRISKSIACRMDRSISPWSRAFKANLNGSMGPWQPRNPEAKANHRTGTVWDVFETLG